MDFNNVLPGLVVIIYILVEIVKRIFIKKDSQRKHIPLIAACLGVTAAILLFYLQPDIMNCSNVLEAIAVGGLSGLGATGGNQLYKQYSKYQGNNS